MKRDYDEELWEQTVFTRMETKTLDRPAQTSEATFVRVRVVDDNGELVGESNLGGAGARRKARGEPTAVLTGDGVPGGSDAVLTTTVAQVPEAMELVWERADSQNGPWTGFDDEDARAKSRRQRTYEVETTWEQSRTGWLLWPQQASDSRTCLPTRGEVVPTELSDSLAASDKQPRRTGEKPGMK